jgi:hypothetical protein
MVRWKNASGMRDRKAGTGGRDDGEIERSVDGGIFERGQFGCVAIQFAQAIEVAES